MTGQEIEEIVRSQGAEEVREGLARAGCEGHGKGLAFYLDSKKSSQDLKIPVDSTVQLKTLKATRGQEQCVEYQPEIYHSRRC